MIERDGLGWSADLYFYYVCKSTALAIFISTSVEQVEFYFLIQRFILWNFNLFHMLQYIVQYLSQLNASVLFHWFRSQLCSTVFLHENMVCFSNEMTVFAWLDYLWEYDPTYPCWVNLCHVNNISFWHLFLQKK